MVDGRRGSIPSRLTPANVFIAASSAGAEAGFISLSGRIDPCTRYSHPRRPMAGRKHDTLETVVRFHSRVVPGSGVGFHREPHKLVDAGSIPVPGMAT